MASPAINFAKLSLTQLDRTLLGLLDVATAHIRDQQPIPDALADTIVELHTLLDAGIDAADASVNGCQRLLPGASTVNLTDDALVFTGGDFQSATRIDAYLPGAYTPLEATMRAIALLTDFTVSQHGFHPNTENLVAAVTPDRWVRLYACDAEDHSWHPQPARPHSSGAVNVTLVTFEAGA